MITQSDAEQLAILDERGRMHRFPMDTEEASAESMREHTDSLRIKVLTVLRAHPGGLTDDEGAQLLNMRDRLTFGRRRQELCIAGLVHDSGKRRASIATGRSCAVWVADPEVTE